jgi:hypothetical protein
MAAAILRIIGTARSTSARPLCRALQGIPDCRATRTIGVRHYQIAQDRPFGFLHSSRLRIVDVIVAEKMQKTVDYEMGEVVVE